VTTDPYSKLVIGVIASARELLEQAEVAVAAEFGPVSRRSPIVPFNYTSYYQSEMGPGLLRQWLATGGLVAAARLAELKLETGKLEDRFRELPSGFRPGKPVAVPGPRRVNLDPGLLSLYNLTLATTKDFAHRVYLHDGIYAEVTLIYKSGVFHPLEWTYPDYRSDTCLSFLAACRHDLIVEPGAGDERSGRV
jgi:hypothetical protein